MAKSAAEVSAGPKYANDPVSGNSPPTTNCPSEDELELDALPDPPHAESPITNAAIDAVAVTTNDLFFRILTSPFPLCFLPDPQCWKCNQRSPAVHHWGMETISLNVTMQIRLGAACNGCVYLIFLEDEVRKLLETQGKSVIGHAEIQPVNDENS
jgi:hypothetical protein